jgi:hypothetical protein
MPSYVFPIEPSSIFTTPYDAQSRSRRGVGMIGVLKACEGEPECTIHPFFGEDVQQLHQVVGVHLLVTDNVLGQPPWMGAAVNDAPAHSTSILRAAVSATAELGHRYRPLVSEIRAQLVAIRCLVASVPVQVDPHNIETTPVNAFPRSGGVSHRASEAITNGGGGLPEEALEPLFHFFGGLRLAGHRRGVHHRLDALEMVCPRDKSAIERRHLAAEHEHHMRRLPAQPLGELSARDEGHEFCSGHVARKRREPDLKNPLRERVPPQVRYAPVHDQRFAPKGAMKIVSDNRHFATNLD